MESDDFTRVSLSWKSSAEGTFALSLSDLKGMIVRVDLVPGAGDVQPADQYDFVLNDEAGVDVLQGGGENVSNASVKTFAPCVATIGGNEVPITVTGDHTLIGSNLGANKEGKVIIRMRY